MSAPPDPAPFVELFERCPDMLAWANVEGRFAFVNPAWSGQLGHDAAALAGQDVLDLVHPDDREAATVAWDAGTGGVHRFAHADGSWRLIRWRVARTGTHAVISAQDVTAEREADAAAGRALDELASTISHDLRSPLRAIDGFSALLLAREDEGGMPPDARRFLGLVRDGLRELAGTVDEVVESVRIARRPPALVDGVDLAALAEELRPDDAAWSVGPLPSCRADPALARRLLELLLSPGADLTFKHRTYVIRVPDRADARVPMVAARIVAAHGGRIAATGEPSGAVTYRFTLAPADG